MPEALINSPPFKLLNSSLFCQGCTSGSVRYMLHTPGKAFLVGFGMNGTFWSYAHFGLGSAHRKSPGQLEKLSSGNDSLPSVLFIYPLPLSSSASVGGRQLSPLQRLCISLEEAICSPRVPRWDWTTWAGQSIYLTPVSCMSLFLIIYVGVLARGRRMSVLMVVSTFLAFGRSAWYPQKGNP